MFKKGQSVHIINQTMSGKFFVEGTAKIIKPTDVEGRYLVRFPERAGAIQCERFVDELAQSDPQAYVNTMNNNRSAVA
jgi:hypothetical protein